MVNRFKAAVSAFRNPGRSVVTLPVITMVSDEQWIRDVEEHAVQRFTEENGRPPKDTNEAVQWVQDQRNEAAE